nr:putative cytochrome P450 [Tanacetum cinerariifolium]
MSLGVYRPELEVKTIINKLREGRLRLFRHVKRRPRFAPVRRVEALVVNGQRRRGRPNLRWEDRLKHDMKNLFLSGDITSDRNEWRARIKLGGPVFICFSPFLKVLPEAVSLPSGSPKGRGMVCRHSTSSIPWLCRIGALDVIPGLLRARNKLEEDLEEKRMLVRKLEKLVWKLKKYMVIARILIFVVFKFFSWYGWSCL